MIEVKEAAQGAFKVGDLFVAHSLRLVQCCGGAKCKDADLANKHGGIVECICVYIYNIIFRDT